MDVMLASIAMLANGYVLLAGTKWTETGRLLMCMGGLLLCLTAMRWFAIAIVWLVT